MQHRKVDKVRKKNIYLVANLEMKHESETMLEVIRGLVLHFVFYFVTVWQSTLYI